MKRPWPLFLAMVLILGTFALPAAADRVALIIGNGDYRHVAPLENPGNDAALTSKLFGALGFDTTVLIDADAAALRDALAAFKTRSEGAETALIYFAGHGIQVDNRNYLLTVDTEGITLDAAVASAVSMNEVIGAFAESAQAKLLFMDACRNNPFEATRGLTTIQREGLARVNHEQSDLLVVYAAQPNRVALDGRGMHSPFTTAVTEVLSGGTEKGLQDALIDVTNHVRTATGGQQTPYIEGTLSFRLTFGRVARAPDPLPASCEGPVQTLGFDRVPGDFVGLDGSHRQLLFGEDVRVCSDPQNVRVSGPFDAVFSCDLLLNSPDEGAGYYFDGPGRAAHHLWFYVDPERQQPALEVGLYREGEQVYWVDTNILICGG